MPSTNEIDAAPAADQRLAEVLTWLASLEPTQRARFLAVLLDTRNHPQLSEVRVAAVFEATRTATHAEVADAIGASRSAVNNAVTQHRRHIRDTVDDR